LTSGNLLNNARNKVRCTFLETVPKLQFLEQPQINAELFMKKNVLFSKGIALCAAMFVLAIAGCPQPDDPAGPSLSGAAALTAVSVAGVSLAAVPQPVSPQAWDDAGFSFAGLAAGKLGQLVLNTDADLVNADVTPTASSGATVKYAAAVTDKPAAGDFGPGPLTLSSGGDLVIQVTAKNGVTINYYVVKINLKDSVTTLASLTIDGTAATLGSPAASADAITNPGAFGISQALSGVTAAVVKANNGQSVQFAKVAAGSSAAPVFGDTAVFDFGDDDELYVKVVAENGSDTGYYKIVIQQNDVITTINAIGFGGTAAALGTPAASAGAISSAGSVTLSSAASTGVAITIEKNNPAQTVQFAKTASGGGVPSVFGETATFDFADGDALYIEVTAANNTNKAYYKIVVRFPSANTAISAITVGGAAAAAGTPAAVYTGADAGSVALNAANHSNAQVVLTKGHAGQTIQFAKVASGSAAEPVFAAAATFNFADGDTLYIKVAAEDGLAVSFYKIAVTVSLFTNAQNPSISTGPADASYGPDGSVEALSVSAVSPDGGSLSYQWYSNTVNSYEGGTLIDSATENTYTPGINLTVDNNYYFWAAVTNTIADNGDGGTKTAVINSRIAHIEVITATSPWNAELTGLTIAGSILSTLPTPVSATGWNAEGFVLSSLETGQLKELKLDLASKLTSAVITATASEEAVVTYAVSNATPPSEFAASPVTLIQDGYLSVKVTSGDEDKVNYYVVKITVADATDTLNGITVAGQTADAGTPGAAYNTATAGYVVLTDAQKTSAAVAVTKAHNGQAIRYAKVTGAGEPQFGAASTFTFAAGDFLYIRVTADNGIAQKVYKIKIEHDSAVLPVIELYPTNIACARDAVVAAFSLTLSGTGTATTYQWYSNTVNSNEDGTLLVGEDQAEFTPPTDTAGTMYYYVVISNPGSVPGQADISITSDTMRVIVTEEAVEDVEKITAGGSCTPAYRFTLPEGKQWSNYTKIKFKVLVDDNLTINMAATRAHIMGNYTMANFGNNGEYSVLQDWNRARLVTISNSGNMSDILGTEYLQSTWKQLEYSILEGNPLKDGGYEATYYPDATATGPFFFGIGLSVNPNQNASGVCIYYVKDIMLSDDNGENTVLADDLTTVFKETTLGQLKLIFNNTVAGARVEREIVANPVPDTE
jgi:hypothetical protein